MRVLLIEDDALLGQAVKAGLTQLGMVVDWVQDGATGSEIASSTEPFDALVLDLGLPRRDGRQVLSDVQARRPALPVIIISARDALHERVDSLNEGADDFILKPFHIEELDARLRAALRKREGKTDPCLRTAQVALNPVTKEVRVQGRPVLLSHKEFALLELLLQKPGAVWSRQALEDKLQGWGDEVLSNAIEVHVYNLRRKLGQGIIQNIRGLGYFVAPSAPSLSP